MYVLLLYDQLFAPCLAAKGDVSIAQAFPIFRLYASAKCDDVYLMSVAPRRCPVSATGPPHLGRASGSTQSAFVGPSKRDTAADTAQDIRIWPWLRMLLRRFQNNMKVNRSSYRSRSADRR